ncbi:MAG: hypothetical protein Q8Q00_00915 [Dehalococcoidia bacterium]|nr:hypothetical protein [Dehalococcoidia bacterium]
MQGEIDILEKDLVLLSGAVRYPATPNLVAVAPERLRARRLAPSKLRVAAVVVAALAALGAGVAVVAPAREAVADLFDKINIFGIDQVPRGLTHEVEGREVSLEVARDALGFETASPNGAQPSKVLLQEFGEVKAAALFFDPSNGPGYVLFETNGRVGKGVPTGGQEAEFVKGLGGEAYWLTGLRLVQYQNLYGDVIYESRRITDQNTLIWSRDGFVFRIEGPLEKEAAVEIAESLR